MPIILPANSAASGGYEVDNSLRFNAGSSDSLTRTFGTPTNNKIWTYSFWMKHCDNAGVLLNTGADTSYMYFRGSSASPVPDGFSIEQYVGGFQYKFIPNQVFRDPSAWQHMVIAFDTTQGTESNRVKIYKNGVQITSFDSATYPSQNLDTQVNSAVAHKIGGFASSGFYDGYLAEVVFIDGQQLDADQFGEFDSDSGIWKPIDVSGLTFGNNGFYLDFEDSSSLGNDAAGSNNFTVNNLTSVDQSLDTCTNNACTWNPLRFWNRSGTLQSPSFDNGNLRAIFDDNGYNEYAFASIGVDTGKWFCEMKAEDVTATGNTRIGVLNMDYTGTGNPGDQSTSVSYLGDGQKRVGGSNSSYGASYTSGDIIGVALDVTNNTVTFYKNGASQGAISITANTLYTFYSEDYASSGNKEISANFS